ncbi:UNVERIFIED_CONTAM: Transcription factor GTE8 [Sesamum calycinum]|uniref:Transcription factor GTE8 n=1 Tax=Sesamum calycinum TaxID=2727403 RepID=A0AAW2MP14_9LAMI
MGNKAGIDVLRWCSVCHSVFLRCWGPDSDRGSECSKDSSAVKQVQDDIGQTVDSEKKGDADELVDGHGKFSIFACFSFPFFSPPSVRLLLFSKTFRLWGECTRSGPDKLYRAAPFEEPICRYNLKSSRKDVKSEKEEPEADAEDARKRAEAEAAAEAKRRRELEREAAREALLKMEKTVEINENSRFLEDLEMLRAVAPEQLPSSVDETSPDHSPDGFGSFKFGGSNPLEQLGLYMKADDEEEEADPPSIPNAVVMWRREKLISLCFAPTTC